MRNATASMRWFTRYARPHAVLGSLVRRAERANSRRIPSANPVRRPRAGFCRGGAGRAARDIAPAGTRPEELHEPQRICSAHSARINGCICGFVRAPLRPERCPRHMRQPWRSTRETCRKLCARTHRTRRAASEPSCATNCATRFDRKSTTLHLHAWRTSVISTCTMFISSTPKQSRLRQSATWSMCGCGCAHAVTLKLGSYSVSATGAQENCMR